MRTGGARAVDGHGTGGSGLRNRPRRGGGRRRAYGRTEGPAAGGPGEKGNGMTAIEESSSRRTPEAPGAIEVNGINVIEESERKGTPAGLFWPWCAANISVFAVSYGAFVLSYGVSFAQAVVAGLIGIVGGFLLVGLVSIAGKRGSAPTLTLSRAPFGRYGNSLPGV